MEKELTEYQAKTRRGEPAEPPAWAKDRAQLVPFRKWQAKKLHEKAQRAIQMRKDEAE